jgi:hypothetical protein
MAWAKADEIGVPMCIAVTGNLIAWTVLNDRYQPLYRQNFFGGKGPKSTDVFG